MVNLLQSLTFNLGASGVSDSITLTTTGGFSGMGDFYFGFASATGSKLGPGIYNLITFTDSANVNRPTLSSFHALATGNLTSLTLDASFGGTGTGFRYALNGSQYTLQFAITGADTVPEPSALALLLMGGALMNAVRGSIGKRQ